jgi:hypothetical protein
MKAWMLSLITLPLACIPERNLPWLRLSLTPAAEVGLTRRALARMPASLAVLA